MSAHQSQATPEPYVHPVFRFSAFHAPTGRYICRGQSVDEARTTAVRGWGLHDDSEIEVLETGDDTQYFWNLEDSQLPSLADVRARYAIIFRGKAVTG